MLQLDFHREAHNLRRFAANFASPFWSALVSFPQVRASITYLLTNLLTCFPTCSNPNRSPAPNPHQPIEGLVAPDVLVETFERGTSVSAYLTSAEGEEERKAQAAQVS